MVLWRADRAGQPAGSEEVPMRNALHRAVLRRLVLRLCVLSAFALAFFTVTAPGAWFTSWGLDAALGRALLAVVSAALLALPAGVVLAAGRRPRARVTAPRAAVGGLQAP